MNIVITGASGFVGRAVTPQLVRAGANVVVAGRKPDRLANLFNDLQVCGYDEIGSRIRGFDLVVHLAASNNHTGASIEEAEEVNARFALEVAQKAAQAGVRKFIYFSSVHALDASNRGAYAQSKRTGASLLEQVQGIEVKILYLPAVVASRFAGKLAILNRWPGPVRRLVFRLLSSLKPTVHVDRITETILSFATSSSVETSNDLLSDTQMNNRIYQSVKRIADLAAALTVLVLFWWLLVAIYVAVRLDTPGPGLFRQTRIGKNRKEFDCYKFRSMAVNTPSVATHDVAPQAVTRVGGLLRRTKLDELPQVWNILRNEMSLIGPRPCLPNQIELIEARETRGVLAIKPGISGYAQINGIDMSNPTVLADWDGRYLALQSLVLDLKIAIWTLRGRGSGDKVR